MLFAGTRVGHDAMQNIDALSHIKVPEQCFAARLARSAVSSHNREARDAYVYLVFHVSRDRVKDALGTMRFFFAPQRETFLKVFVSVAF